MASTAMPGNSSGDRSSGSSASVSSMESPYYAYMAANRRPFGNLAIQRLPPSPKLSSDQGYDSFSLSSTDSYPSVFGSSSPSKLNPRLKQIPEDVQLMELMNTSTMLDCDELCLDADVLLLKSHEKEREGDLRAAAALSDSAASKARSAMDAPYSNHQTLITAKMKHSMCVMRSASLHKRVKEMESEEKRRFKEQLNASTNSTIEYHHSRQSSRDSTHSKHSRQGSKDSKDGKSKEFNTKHASLELNKNRINEGSISAGKTLELYATLPKKGSKKKVLQQSLNSLASLRIKNDKNDDSNIYNDIISRRDSVPNYATGNSQTLPKKKVETNKKSVDIKLVPKVCHNVKQIKDEHLFKQSSRESDLSDYYSEWESTRRSQQPLQRTISGSASCRENDSEFYGEVGTFSPQSTGKKQHKVRRKLLMGGFMKRKNRSLPDLREGVKNGQIECTNDIQSEIEEKESLNGLNVAQISAKGFHQPHRAFISERGLYQRPSLLKVSPPLIEKSDGLNHSSHTNNYKLSTNIRSRSSHSNTSTFSPTDSFPRPPTPPKAKSTASVVPTMEVDSRVSDIKPIGSNFLRELASKRAEIMNSSHKEKLIQSASHEQINNGIQHNSSINVKSVLQNLMPTHNINTENHNYETIHYQSNNYSIKIPNPNINPESPCSQTSLHSSIKNSEICEQTNDSSAGISLVKDLTSKFEKIMNKQEDKPQNDKLNETLETREQKRANSNGLHRIMALLTTNNQNEDLNTQKQVIPTLDTNISDEYLVQSNIPSPMNSSIPVKNSVPPALRPNRPPDLRPNRPPDYQTAMKRIGMLRSEKSVLNIQQPRPFYMNVSGNIVQPNSPRSPTSQIPPQLNESQKSDSLNINSELPKQQSVNKTQPKFDEPTSPIRKKNGFKKSVSFSDQVVLVACAEDEQEEYLPNPLLERYLGKNSSNESGLFVEKSPQHSEYHTSEANEKAIIEANCKAIFPIAGDLKSKLLTKYQTAYNSWPNEKKRRDSEIAENFAKLLQDNDCKSEAKEAKKLAELQSKLNNVEERNALAVSNLSNNEWPQSGLDLGVDSNTKQLYSMPKVDRTTKPSLLSFHDKSDCLRRVIIPQSLFEKFLSISKRNTDLNIETCAILAGKYGRNAFTITHILLPKQRGTADSCLTHNEEEVFVVQDKYDLITVGWIHTHPTQSSFMSSIDLHTHCSYQLMLPEAIAIVCAPKFGQIGIFSLTDPHGLQSIANCKLMGFHPHPNDPSIYHQSLHVVFDDTIQVNLIDFR